MVPVNNPIVRLCSLVLDFGVPCFSPLVSTIVLGPSPSNDYALLVLTKVGNARRGSPFLYTTTYGALSS